MHARLLLGAERPLFDMRERNDDAPAVLVYRGSFCFSWWTEFNRSPGGRGKEVSRRNAAAGARCRGQRQAADTGRVRMTARAASPAARGVLRIAERLELPLDAVTQTFAILGIRGSGKTNTGVVMAEEMRVHEQQFVVL